MTSMRIVQAITFQDGKAVWSDDLFRVIDPAAPILNNAHVLFEGTLEECIDWRRNNQIVLSDP